MRIFFLFVIILLNFISPLHAQNLTSITYDIGSPTLVEIWVDPTSGNDTNSGNSRSTALRTITAAWQLIPQGTTLTTGYKIQLVAGDYAESIIPNYWESRYGTAQYPVILNSVDGKGRANLLGDINAFDLRYFYLIDIDIIPSPAGDAFHCEQCDHVLMRGMELSGGAREAQETIKVNQSQYVYIEDSNIHGASDNAIDFVSVQYGHVVRNSIHDAEDWCMYAKGGSAYLVVEGNNISNCGTGGFTAGQGTGFEFMSSPWLHYEAYDIKFINNIVHDVEGAGFGVNGGYNILLAHNTLYKVGTRSHLIEVVPGIRSCDGNTTACSANVSAGGWGTGNTSEEFFIGSKNIFIYNNLVYNPSGTVSGSTHFSIQGPRANTLGSGPNPAVMDSNLQIKGNIIYNGGSDMPLGVDEDTGCASSNPTCNTTQLLAENSINAFEPALSSPSTGDYRPVVGGNMFTYVGASVPSFSGGDRVTPPLAPAGSLGNSVARDYSSNQRSQNYPVGAFAGPIRGRSVADAYLPWNGFLGMYNILELVNPSSSAVGVTITLFDISGTAVGQTTRSIAALGQTDVIVNEISGFSTTSYGLITLDYDGTMNSKMSFYKPTADNSEYDFAYGVPWSGALTGTSFVGFNTFQPSRKATDATSPVSNWLSIVNYDGESAHTFTVKYYDYDGLLFRTETATVSPFARFDLEAGHVNPGANRVGLLEVIPDTDSVNYSAFVIRYGQKGGEVGAYSFAFPLFAGTSPGTTQVLPVSTGGGAQNWVEVVNTSGSSAVATLNFYNQEGTLYSGSPVSVSIPSHSQSHFNATNFLGSGAIGKATVSSGASSLIAQSMYYFYESDGAISSMYGTQGVSSTTSSSSGSYNLYLGMYNWMKLVNLNSVSSGITLKVYTASGVTTKDYTIPANGSIDLGLHDQAQFGASSNTYGVVTLSGAGVFSQILRLRQSSRGSFDFAYVTPVE